MSYNCLFFWQQVICFKSLNLGQVTSKYSERLYLCLNNCQCNLNSKSNHLSNSLSVTECTLGCQYISVTLYLLPTYPSGKPLLKGQSPANLTNTAKGFLHVQIFQQIFFYLLSKKTFALHHFLTPNNCILETLWKQMPIYFCISL